MKDPRCSVLVFLVVSTSLNRSSKLMEFVSVDAQNLKSYERRASGLVPFPRIGRHFAMASFARADGNAGLVNYPRVGRAGSVAYIPSFGPSGISDFDSDLRLDVDRDFDNENMDDFDYNSKHYASEWEESGKQLEDLKNDMWLGISPDGGSKKKHRHSQRCKQQVDGPWALLFATREMTNLNHEPGRNSVPRLVRNVETETVTPSNIIS